MCIRGRFNIDNDNDLLFLYKLSFEDLKKIHNILTAKDTLFDKINGAVKPNTNKIDESNVNNLVKSIISEIHLLGGNTLVNLGRGNQGVPYKEIVKDVCERKMCIRDRRGMMCINGNCHGAIVETLIRFGCLR